MLYKVVPGLIGTYRYEGGMSFKQARACLNPAGSLKAGSNCCAICRTVRVLTRP